MNCIIFVPVILLFMDLTGTIPSQTLDELLPEFYSQYNLGKDGGIHKPMVKIEFTPRIFYFIPNWNERRRAVEKHDMHHIITGYHSTIKGEAEICAWEIASGCKNYWAAWILDMQAMGLVWFYPLATFKAFIRGLHSANLYHDTIPIEKARKLTTSELREQLHIPDTDQPLPPVFADYCSFTWWAGLSNLFALFALILTPFIILFNVYILFKALLAKEK